DMRGHLTRRYSQPTPADDPASLQRMIEQLLATNDGMIEAVVVGVPGVVDYQDGSVLRFPNLPGWNGQISEEQLTDELDIPVQLANDADLAALGEHRYGAGRGFNDIVYVTVSTGIGAGVVIEGLLLTARYSLGEIGQSVVDWNTGEVLEAVASGTALAQAAGMDARTVVERAFEGDKAALGHLDRAGRALGAGLLNLVRLYAPEAIIVGGGLGLAAGGLLLDPVRAVWERSATGAPWPQLIPAALGDDAGLMGAAAFWQDLFIQEAAGLI
ncbi:MAG: ROK family protein, partial [Chloroflexota bacterium]